MRALKHSKSFMSEPPAGGSSPSGTRVPAIRMMSLTRRFGYPAQFRVAGKLGSRFTLSREHFQVQKNIRRTAVMVQHRKAARLDGIDVHCCG